MQKVRINLSVDEGIPEMMERQAGGRNKMGDYLSKLIRSQGDEGATSAELAAMDNESLRLMVQGLGGRMRSVEGEVIRLQAQMAALLADAR